MSDLADVDPLDRGRRLPAAPKLPGKRRKAKPVPEKTAHRTWGRYVLWAVIALFGVAAVAEFRAQWAFNKTLSICNGVLEGNRQNGPEKHVTFDQLKEELPANPVHTEEMQGGVKNSVYTWTWQGVRRYKVRLFVSPKDGAIWYVESGP